MFHKILIIVLSVIGIGALLHLTGCHPGFRMHHCRKYPKAMIDKVIKKISKECELNDSQKAKLVDLKETFIQEHESMFEQHQSKFDILLAEIEKEELDQQKFNQTFEDGIQQKQEIHKKIVAKFAEFHALLTPEQKQKLTGLIRKHHDKMAKHFGQK